MKNITKKIGIIFAAVLTLFGFAACGDDPAEAAKTNPIAGKTYYAADKLIISNEQVWVHNPTANIINQVYFQFTEDRKIDVNAFVYQPGLLAENPGDPPYINVGLGSIEKGILNVEVTNLNSNELIDWSDFDIVYFREWYLVENYTGKKVITVDPIDAKLNNVLFDTNDNGDLLSREGLFGTIYMLGMDSLFFIYAGQPCTITGKKTDGYWPGEYFYNLDPFVLNLNHGWNVICKKIYYGQSGKSTIILEKQNPDYLKWVKGRPQP